MNRAHRTLQALADVLVTIAVYLRLTRLDKKRDRREQRP